MILVLVRRQWLNLSANAARLKSTGRAKLIFPVFPILFTGKQGAAA
jgi:hypothetical protein